MKCTTCGNPVPRGAAVCPYCESPLSREARPRPPLVKTLNLKTEGISADLVGDRMETMVANAKAGGTKVVILIHGYGSGGQGGSIRKAARERLAQMRAARRVRTVIPGEEFGPSSDDAIRVASNHQALLARHVFGAENPGITIAEL